MATCTADQMTNHHHKDVNAANSTGLGQLLRTWHQRFTQRDELAHLTERDLNDVGITWDDVAHEVDKPFWRA
ncbi:hypothetical protein ASC80_16895 [Afipia sp. Root123D2]|nr:hypothetical protein ASC80_16895 [Afipia sp. Root123D2]